MELPEVVERWNAGVNELTLGTTAAQGGTRTATVTIGGERTVPFMTMDGNAGHRPAIALDVLDIEPEGWPESLLRAYGDVVKDPAAWARKCITHYGAEMICLQLLSTDPNGLDRGPDEAAVRPATRAAREGHAGPSEEGGFERFPVNR
jgi:acetyl-CoA decarbonylase/synthase complex subunit delta